MNIKSKGYFEGWYYKQQAGGHTLALIPGRSDNNAFIQVITEQSSYNVTYNLQEFKRDGEHIQIGDNDFSPNGVNLNIYTKDITLTGMLGYQNLSPIRGDIMGVFRFFPMECRHGVRSMLHQVNGNVILNGRVIDFSNSRGYIENDRGSSFPTEYMWVQCNDFAGENSIMVSVARIPFAGFHFWGCIAVVWLDGREYRLATYRGVKIVRCEQDRLTLKQGEYRLDIEFDSKTGHTLYAPKSGSMNRTIRENVACPAHFCFYKSSRILFEAASSQASCEIDGITPC